MLAAETALDFFLLSWHRNAGTGDDGGLAAAPAAGNSGLAVVTLAGLVLALGNRGYVYAWLKHVAPWIGFARFPIKFVSIPVFTIPLLAAYGLNTFSKRAGPETGNEMSALFFSRRFFTDGSYLSRRCLAGGLLLIYHWR